MAEQLPEYRVPLKDMQFLLNEMSEGNHQDDVASEDLFFILEQAARFAEEELAPINQAGDDEGCVFDNGKVTLPPKLNQAFRTYAEAGWMGLSMPEEWGGQALPERLSSLVGEILTSANHAFSMTPALTMSACRAIISHGTDEIKQTYLEKLIMGEWTGTMCLTEAHCGSDLGLVRTSAEEVSDGVYKIKGNKIFISSGQHDAADNIIHLVLARLKGAPQGIKGLSLFIVPAKLQNKAGVWNKNNAVHCIGIEEKMGMHANPTCSMSFEEAEGYLLGQPNRGINAMFTMMNEMRLGASMQGIGLSERSFQKSLAYAVERTQMRSLGGVKAPDKEADPIIVHPDVRRMLLTQKVFAEGGRALGQFCANLLDESHLPNADKERVELLGFLTPIAKGFLTDTGLASADMAIQMYGGHGFIKETGAEQLFRDGRASTLYEGTTGIQALDLLGRKVLAGQGKSLLSFTKMLHVLSKNTDSESLADLADVLGGYAKEWPELAKQLGAKGMGDFEEVGAASFDFLMYSGYATLAYFWLKMAAVAQDILDGKRHPKGDGFDRDFLDAKVKNARFYFERILPRARAHKEMMLAGKGSMMNISEAQLIG
ncbi:acyl-CoA dehydrogenase C-terminal domain-containing protein [Litoribacillus peritrichatus]|uniref:Acyl-CoA dehydrogenase C-terminal domain-containing protein n=1 Tax=Litoribacillus peritrichatus TaxID=718191 RepID=A0ABP7MJ48_9GAMM